MPHKTQELDSPSETVLLLHPTTYKVISTTGPRYIFLAAIT